MSESTHLLHLLFVCGKNRWRSPTAEQVFAEYPGVACLSAGVSHDADTPLSTELVDWADTIFVMEKQHLQKLKSQFQPHLRDKRVVCLDIADNYRFMDAALVELLKRRVTRFLPPLVPDK